jgi:hypothetical protein
MTTKIDQLVGEHFTYFFQFDQKGQFKQNNNIFSIFLFYHTCYYIFTNSFNPIFTIFWQKKSQFRNQFHLTNIICNKWL